MNLENLAWVDAAHYEKRLDDYPLSHKLMEKARDAILRDLAAVLAWERLQEAIPEREAEFDARREALAEQERRLEAKRAELERMQTKNDELYAEWQRLEPAKTHSSKAGRAAWDAQQAYRAHKTRLRVVENQEQHLRDQVSRERIKLDGAPRTMERLRAIERPATPDLDTVLEALGLS